MSVHSQKHWLVVLAITYLFALAQPIVADETCPRSVGASNLFSEPWPQANSWFGSESLAVVLPENGIWSTTADGALIAVKLFWYSVGFQPGMERDFTGRIDRLDDGPNDAVLTRATNAGLANGVWTVLTGIDFKSAGCWRVTGNYRGQSLEFVVETVPHAELSAGQQGYH